MKKKLVFEEPVVRIVSIRQEDIITTSPSEPTNMDEIPDEEE